MFDSPAIDGTFVGRHADGVAGAQFGGETVLIDTTLGRSHVLNTSASLVWMLLDGAATLGEICTDVAAEFSTPAATVFAEASTIIEQMLAMGVVVDTAQLAESPAPSTEPANTSWFDENFPLGDAGVLHLRAGDRPVAVRTNTEGMVDIVRAVFAPSLCDGADDADAGPPTILSILVTPTRGRVAGAHFLYRDGRLSSRSATVGRVVRALRAQLDDLARPDDDLVRLNATLLARGDRVVLVANRAGDLVDVDGRTVAGRGWSVVDVPAPVLDPSTFEVVIPARDVAVDDAAWEAFDAAHPSAPGELVLPPGRYPVQRLVVLDATDADASDAQPPAQRAMALLPFVPALDAERTVEVLQVLAELAEETQVLQSRGWLARDLAGALPA